MFILTNKLFFLFLFHSKCETNFQLPYGILKYQTNFINIITHLQIITVIIIMWNNILFTSYQHDVYL